MGRNPVRVTHTQETLKNVLREIADASHRIQDQLDFMTEEKIESITMKTGQREMERGLRALQNFADYVKAAIRDVMRERGDFGMEDAGPEAKLPASK